MKLGVAAALLVLLAGAMSAGAAPRHDYALVARDILPPGNFGGINFTTHSTDQAVLYDALTPLFDKVTQRDITRNFKAEPLWTGKEKAVRLEKPGRGVVIRRDAFDVPHVFGKKETDVFYGAGYAAAEDRGVLMELARYPGRLACIDAPGFNAFAVALSGNQFRPSQAVENRLAQQIAFLTGKTGLQELADIDAYVAGVNAQRKAANLEIAPWTRVDVVATTCLLGARFGAGGGDEARRSEFYAAIDQHFNAGRNTTAQIYDQLRRLDDASAPTTLTKSFPYGPQGASGPGPGNVVLDDASVTAPAPLRAMSNAILIGARRSTTGHPIMVAGPQLGYFYPEFFWEVDMEGGGVSVRGGSLAGIPNVLIGRGPDYGWSFTSSQSDNIDTFAEELCGDDHHYVYRGTCTAMTHVDAGVLIVAGASKPVGFWETNHGPVIGYGTVAGRRVALSSMRSTRGRELKAALDVYALSTGRLASAQQFTHDLSRFEMSFNGFYVDSKHIAFVSSGRLPVRASGVDPGFPTLGTGAFEWRGFLAPAQHPQAIDPPGGAIVNWNNKPAPDFDAADDNFSFGPVHRSQLLSQGVKPGRNSVLDVVRTMNKAATQDLRAVQVWPKVAAMLRNAPPPSTRAQQAADLVGAWVKNGGSRLDRNLDGKVDDPGAGILDAAWPGLADAVVRPTLGSLTDRLATLMEIDDAASPQGSAYIDGWYGYVARFLYCGNPPDCAKSLWAALDAVATAPLADATKERITFAPGFLPTTMRWTNRPTYQQVLSFDGHR